MFLRDRKRLRPKHRAPRSGSEVSGRDIRLFISAASQEHEPHLSVHVTAFTLAFTQAECRTTVFSGIDLVHLLMSLKYSRVPDGNRVLGHVDDGPGWQVRAVMRDLEKDLSKQVARPSKQNRTTDASIEFHGLSSSAIPCEQFYLI